MTLGLIPGTFPGILHRLRAGASVSYASDDILPSVSLNSRRATGPGDRLVEGKNWGLKPEFSCSSGSATYVFRVLGAVRCVPGIIGSAATSGELRLSTSLCTSEVSSREHSGPASTIIHCALRSRSPSRPEQQASFGVYYPKISSSGGIIGGRSTGSECPAMFRLSDGPFCADRPVRTRLICTTLGLALGTRPVRLHRRCHGL